ncbi:MAG: VWA domain-containing protein [Deltaproteobacteria bacterium]|nr:VWA domain-containing protein [Deltaproteobacteria bacterium]
MRSLRRVALLLPLALVASLACTNQKLVPVIEPEPDAVDDLLEIETHFCTRPSADIVFPVKLLLVVDTSGSMQFTDQPGLRVNAVRELMSALATQEDVLVSTMGFGSNIYLDPPVGDPTSDPMFIPAADWQEPPFLQIKDVATDYHGAWSAVQQHLLIDMLRTAPAERARTKYIVIFFSDGAPDPRCCSSADETVGTLGSNPYNCPLEAWEAPQPGRRYCEDESELDLCNESDYLDQFQDNVSDVVLGQSPAGSSMPTPNYGDDVLSALNDLELEGNYNRTYQIEGLVEDIVELGEEFGVGQLQINTALLFDSQLPDAVKEIYRLNKCRSESLLMSLAQIGGGQYRDFENAGEIDFLSFNFTSLKSGYSLVSTFATNLNALPPGGDPTVVTYRADSDGDGLDDEEEFLLGTNAVIADSDRLDEPLQADVVDQDVDGFDDANALLDPDASDPCNPNPASAACTGLPGDGWEDGIEQERANIGFDPRYTGLPLDPCPYFDPTGVDREDDDGDGLNGCEEFILDTNPKVGDTDGDTVPDGVEVRLGLDPIENESGRDDDFDGVQNTAEVRKGTDPLVPDADREEDAVRYELVEEGATEDGRVCYTSITRGLHLASTAPRRAQGRRGYNDIAVWIAEAPAENPTGRMELRVACVRVQYAAPSFKDPATGKIVIENDAFYDLSLPDVQLAIAPPPSADNQLYYGSAFHLSGARDANGEPFCRGLEVR